MGRLPHRSGQAIRYRHVLYHSREAEPWMSSSIGKGGSNTWFLLVPPDSEAWLPTEEVVRLISPAHANRALLPRLEKPLGLRGLHLQVRKSERLLRLLMGFTLAYLMVLLLGQDPLAQRLRPLFEQPRRRPRHGTKKVLSVLSIALYLLSDSRWGQRCRNACAPSSRD